MISFTAGGGSTPCLSMAIGGSKSAERGGPMSWIFFISNNRQTLIKSSIEFVYAASRQTRLPKITISLRRLLVQFSDSSTLAETGNTSTPLEPEGRQVSRRRAYRRMLVTQQSEVRASLATIQRCNGEFQNELRQGGPLANNS